MYYPPHLYDHIWHMILPVYDLISTQATIFWFWSREDTCFALVFWALENIGFQGYTRDYACIHTRIHAIQHHSVQIMCLIYMYVLRNLQLYRMVSVYVCCIYIYIYIAKYNIIYLDSLCVPTDRNEYWVLVDSIFSSACANDPDVSYIQMYNIRLEV